MKHNSFPRYLAVFATPLFLALALVLPGCATRSQVTKIVAESNAAMLAGQFGLPEPGATTDKPAWQEASDRIEAFIAAHPDQQAAAAPLHVRQAMLLLTFHQFSLAEAAFNAVVVDDLHADRDKALKNSQGTLIWWFANSTKHTWSDADQAKAKGALSQLKEQQSQLNDSPEIRDYLAEMRAWIGLAAAKQTTSTNRARELVENSLDVYAEIFTSEDLVIILTGKEEIPDPKALGPEARRRLRSRAVLDAAKEQNLTNSLGAHPKNPEFDQLINR